MKTLQAVVCLAMLTTTACGSVTFSTADDAGTDADPTQDVQAPKPDADPKPDSGHSCTSCKLDAGSDAGHVKDPDAGHDAGHAPDAVTPEDGSCCGVDAGSDAGKDSSEPDVKVIPDSGHVEDGGHTMDGSEDGGHAEDAGKDSAPVCMYETPKCSGNIILACGDSGTVATPCSGTTPVCLELAGVGTCVPCAPSTLGTPDTQCANDSAGYYSEIQTCNAQGQWGDANGVAGQATQCGSATPVCKGAVGSGQCGGQCVPGATQCTADTTGPNNVTTDGLGHTCIGTLGQQTCDNNGIWGAIAQAGLNQGTFEEGAIQLCDTSSCTAGIYCGVMNPNVCPDWQ